MKHSISDPVVRESDIAVLDEEGPLVAEDTPAMNGDWKEAAD